MQIDTYVHTFITSRSQPAKCNAACARAEFHHRLLRMCCGWTPRMTTMTDGTTQTELLFSADSQSGREAFTLVLPNNGSPRAHIERLARSVHQLEMVVAEAKDLQRRHCRGAVVRLAHPAWTNVGNGPCVATVTMRFATSQCSRAAPSQFQVRVYINAANPFAPPTYECQILFGHVTRQQVTDAISNVSTGHRMLTRIYESMLMLLQG